MVNNKLKKTLEIFSTIQTKPSTIAALVIEIVKPVAYLHPFPSMAPKEIIKKRTGDAVMMFAKRKKPRDKKERNEKVERIVEIHDYQRKFQ